MELDRRAYAEESQALLRKQQTTIDKLRRDNDSIKGEIAILMRSSSRPLSTTQQEAIHRLHEQGDKYANAIEFERKNMDVMEDQINIMKQKVLNQRRSMGGVNASKDNFYMIQKQIRILENRLDKALIKFNESIAHNKTLRDEIDDLRRERVVFENIYRKMERELQERKQKMAEIIETANQAYEQRDTYQMEVAAIEQANRKEQEEFEEQMVELTRMLESELRLPNPGAMTTRLMASSSNGYMAGTDQTGKGETTYSPSKGGSPGARGTGSKGATWSATNAAHVQSKSFERVQNFEEAFNKIKSATGITDIEELVRTFIKNEDHNFSLFNYVNEQNNEIEKLEEQIQTLREEERKFAVESGEDFHQHKQILKELENKLLSTDSMAEKYEIRCQDLQRVIESLKRGIQNIYEKFEADGDAAVPLSPMRASQKGGTRSSFMMTVSKDDTMVTESNMVHYLGLIEQRANLLLQNYAEVKLSVISTTSKVPPGGSQESKEAVDEAAASMAVDMVAAKRAVPLASVLGTGPKVPMGQDLIHVNPPKLDDYQSDEEEEEEGEEEARPLTREELKTRTLNRLQRRGQTGNGAKGATKKKTPTSKMNVTR